ncbi:MAG: 4Fe-4S dicluster domain-containing protein [Nitrospiraceae bacterium]|nr:4Fe-4S dicluster domain-containing protein [Nitrospiraceae bacterium]
MLKQKLKKEHLGLLFDKLKVTHGVLGPKVENGVVTLAEIDAHDIPSGYEDHQQPGGYRLIKGERPEIFSFSIGPDSFKRFLQPPLREVFAFRRAAGISITRPGAEQRPLAFIDMRPCDLSALKLYDRIFLRGPVRDPYYDSLRRDSLVFVLNCLYPNDNCFCPSMGTGPEATDGFDVALTELSDSFLLEAGTAKGETVLAGLPAGEVDDSDMREKGARIELCRKRIKKFIRAGELPGLIYRNVEHPRWAEIAERDLECGNCTQLCPTCFCNSTYDALGLSGISKKSYQVSGRRMRKWDSCFSKNFARVHGGNFRPSRRARYRQWMSHKLAYTMEQFGLPGCVGCGRCITWCPAGIDITKELEALKSAR